MPQILLDTDTFGGTDGTNLATYSANWNFDDGSNYDQCAIRSTPGCGRGGFSISQNSRSGQTWTDDQWAEIISASNTTDTWFMVMVRVAAGSSPLTGYWGGFNWAEGNTIYRIGTMSGTTATVLATDPGANTFSLGDIINLQVVGTSLTLTVTRSSSQLTQFSVTDSTYSTGRPGLSIRGSGTNKTVSQWNAGSASVASGLLFRGS